MRADLVREIKKDSKLPRDLEARLFGYFDTLEATRPAAKEGASEAAAPTAKAPVAPVVAPKE